MEFSFYGLGKNAKGEFMSAPEIICEIDCGNSPRKAWLRDFNSAFASANIDEILKKLSDQIIWNVISTNPYTFNGILAVREELKKMKNAQVQKMTIHSIITHGKTAALEGEMLLKNNDTYAFCDIYEFANTKSDSPIIRFKSFVVKLESTT